VKHITPARLGELEPLLAELRRFDSLREKKRGVFYRKSRAFLHFHEDASGLFADVRLGASDFDRFRVSTRAECAALLREIERALEAGGRANDSQS